MCCHTVGCSGITANQMLFQCSPKNISSYHTFIKQLHI
uniref:Uncharacterized protein n=1 Tax=Anguilla anguilla TaxID=7936 RepID=A0A0E9XGN0_ANGAN